MDSKECTKCGDTKPADSFHWKVKSKGRRQSACKQCQSIAFAAYRENNREKLAQKEKERRARNPEDGAQAAAIYRALNPEKARQSCRDSHNKNKVKRNAAQRQYSQSNPALFNAKAKKYKAAKIQRTVSWANDQLIAAYYKEAKRLEELTGIKFHVDHIIPLQGDLVSGLHVETNLQLLPAHENLVKKNSFDPELFCA